MFAESLNGFSKFTDHLMKLNIDLHEKLQEIVFDKSDQCMDICILFESFFT